MIGFRRSGDRWRVGAGRRDAVDPLAADTARGDGVTDPPPASPSSDSTSHAALGWTMVAVAAVVLVFLLAPFGPRGASSAIDPATSTGPDAPLESTSPRTWVLSSTVVTSLPADHAAPEPGLDGTDATGERPSPWIIRVPRTTPAGQADHPATAPTVSVSATAASPAARASASVPATSTGSPGGSCLPSSPAETASPPAATASLPAVDGDGVGRGGDAGPGELGSTSGPNGDAGRAAPSDGARGG
ncbi:hypothetical protein [Dietzia massiliensis]|uniref:hypothetical protein n=1 Tax=Dietzia massiliensis TaxID=2697499 RepID=UPI001BCEBFBA|nr:hypothetical protein [Dietzia massiliensis]MBS7548842.1 hypothetical protein [Dietzia massiliensis]